MARLRSTITRQATFWTWDLVEGVPLRQVQRVRQADAVRLVLAEVRSAPRNEGDATVGSAPYLFEIELWIEAAAFRKLRFTNLSGVNRDRIQKALNYFGDHPKAVVADLPMVLEASYSKRLIG